MPSANLSDFLKLNEKKPDYVKGRIIELKDAALDFIDEMGTSMHTPKSFVDNFALDCKAKVQTESKAIAQMMSRDALEKAITGPARGEVIRKFQAIIAASKEKARLFDMEAAALKISDYYEGKERRISMGGTITITIEEAAWDTIVRGQGNVEQIKGILANDPIQVLPSGNLKGVRCIKPEPYGWIFSTSVTLRLVDDTTDVGTFPPAQLTFNTTRQGH